MVKGSGSGSRAVSSCTEEIIMKQYLLSVMQPGGGPPGPEVLAEIGERLEAFHQELREAGAWVFAGGLQAPATATVVRPTDPDGEDLRVIEGPYAEAKEHLGGLCIVSAPDRDTALGWGRKAARATTLPIEVRPFQGGTDD
ncbi:hypothetical protein N566_11445 [Streptomycetaceae bacterium MP113-05]|nr:hypothetical protein N566_11445 [Streptomycetaceae bacterium MP113-05]